MAKTKLRWVKGNYLKLAIPLEKQMVMGGVATSEPYTPPEGSDITVTMIGSFHRHQFATVTQDDNVLTVEDNGTLSVDVYAVEVTVTEPALSGGKKLRSMWKNTVEIGCDNAGKLDEYNDFIGDESMELEAAVFYSHEGGDVTIAVSRAFARMGYYVCPTEGGTATKAVTVPSEYDYGLGNGGSIKVNMEHANTSDDAVTLKIGNSDPKKLYYDGLPVSSSNTWEDGETVEVYYVSSANNGNGAFFANNVSGGGKFATGEKVRYTQIQRAQEETDTVLPTVGTLNAAIETAEERIGGDITDLDNKINALSAGLKVTLSVSPSTIYRNEPQSLTLTGTMSNGTPTSMKIMDGSTELPTTGTNPVISQPSVTVSGASKTYTIQGVTLGMTLNGSATVNARYPIFYGFGANAAAVVADADAQSPVNAIRYAATTSAAHTYERTLAGSTDLRFYILVPSDITAPTTDKFTMGGAPFVMTKTTQSLTVKGNSVSYSVYASGYEYASGTKIKVEVKS